jgi:hypothetical protein
LQSWIICDHNIIITDNSIDYNLLSDFLVEDKLDKFLGLLKDVELNVLKEIDKFNRYTLLHDAAALARPLFVKSLLEAGADIEARDKWGNTPIRRVGENYNNSSNVRQAIYELLKFNPDLNTENNYKVKFRYGTHTFGKGIPVVGGLSIFSIICDYEVLYNVALIPNNEFNGKMRQQFWFPNYIKETWTDR